MNTFSRAMHVAVVLAVISLSWRPSQSFPAKNTQSDLYEPIYLDPPRCPRDFQLDCIVNGTFSMKMDCETDADCHYNTTGAQCCTLNCEVICIEESDLIELACPGDNGSKYFPGDQFVRGCEMCNCGNNGRAACMPLSGCGEETNLLGGRVLNRKNYPPEGTEIPRPEEQAVRMFDEIRQEFGKVMAKKNLLPEEPRKLTGHLTTPSNKS